MPQRNLILGEAEEQDKAVRARLEGIGYNEANSDFAPRKEENPASEEATKNLAARGLL